MVNPAFGVCVIRWSFLLELLSSGMTHAEILEDYDDLEEADILSALLYATRLSQVKSIYKLAS